MHWKPQAIFSQLLIISIEIQTRPLDLEPTNKTHQHLCSLSIISTQPPSKNAKTKKQSREKKNETIIIQNNY